jgi:hypothetical protein
MASLLVEPTPPVEGAIDLLAWRIRDDGGISVVVKDGSNRNLGK